VYRPCKGRAKIHQNFMCDGHVVKYKHTFVPQIIIIIILIVIGAALCACLEAAFFTVSLGSAKLFKEKGSRGGRALLKVKERIHSSVITLVILNNTITIAGSIYIGHLTTELYGNEIIGLVSTLLTATIIIFGEIIPKMIGENYARRISLLFATPVLFLTWIFYPITYSIEFLMSGFMKKHSVISEDELKMLSQMGEAEGSIERDEQELIQRAFTLNDLSAKDIMTPRTVIEGLPADVTIREVKAIVSHKPYSRYPVYNGTLDTIVGICHTRDILTALAADKDEEKISSFAKPTFFVSEKKRVDDLLRLFLSKRSHMAIVQDDYGATVGVVTLEDALETLVGEIVDETDEVVDLQSLARTLSSKRE
jgi:CBS domain containing-hemolysin-like protein